MPVITTDIVTAINFCFKFVIFLNASSAPIQRLGEEKSCANHCLSNMDAKRHLGLDALLFDVQGLFPGRSIIASDTVWQRFARYRARSDRGRPARPAPRGAQNI